MGYMLETRGLTKRFGRGDQAQDAVAGYGLGADDYVRKPFGAAELRAKVAAHLRRERRPRSHAQMCIRDRA